MYFLLSPAKSLNETNPIPTHIEKSFAKDFSQPALMAEACDLMATLKQLEPTDIMSLMGVSAHIAQINALRFQNWVWDTDKLFRMDNQQLPAKPAIYLFDGDVYTGLDAYQLDGNAIAYLQQHLGILSGLYGVLKPLDLILPYRLEMSTKLPTTNAKNLYEFWGNKITDIINQRLSLLSQPLNNPSPDIATGEHDLINLASNEYFKAINPKTINADIITPRFEDSKDGKVYKVVSFYAKKARGLMLKYACQHNLQHAKDLKSFDLDGYHFIPEISNSTEYIFRRINHKL